MKPTASCLALLLMAAAPAPAQSPQPWWPAAVEQALGRAGDNRPELEKALREVPRDQRPGMAFLVENMPGSDLRSLKAVFLLENVRLAYRARGQLPWGQDVPEEVFLNHVLPYANVNEARDPWRREMFDLCLPLVEGCKTPAEAAHKLNSTIFTRLRVKYSTRRRLPHQSPQESIESGLASCTGLSILLADACRSVGVPARLVGTPLWADGSGNHTWVEVWDGGWHFTGACEPSPEGLDHAWFTGRAAQAKKDARLSAIYAASFRKTDTTFPLVWSPGHRDVSAENVTDRYARPQEGSGDTVRVLVRVRRGAGRVAVPVAVIDPGSRQPVAAGTSRGESADANDLLTFELKKGRDYVIRTGTTPPVEKQLHAPDRDQVTVDVQLPDATADETDGARLAETAAKFFASSPEERAKFAFPAELDALVAGDEEAARRLVWQAYRAAPVHDRARQDFDKEQVTYEQHTSPYTVKTVGKRPDGGWPLFIAMHGGGGVPKQVNDSQWDHMKVYYEDQPSVTGYKYLALRAPNDVWNGFYDTYTPPLVANLIRQFLLCGDVDPDKVFLMGYSHGGYGAFYIGPKIPHRFAAVHASAAAPTDGTISPRSLLNTRFTFMVGEKDIAYGRRTRCEAFAQQIAGLKERDQDSYPVVLEFQKGYGHGGLPDRDKIKDMYPSTRNPVPRHVVWDLTDDVLRDFFWLTVPEPSRGGTIDASVRDNHLTVAAAGVKGFTVWLDGRLVDTSRPLRVTLNGREQVHTPQPSLANLCRSLLERGDPQLAFTCRLDLVGGE